MAVSDDPADAGLFSTIASLLAGEGLPEQAAEAARIAVALAPSDPALWNELANRLKGLGRIADSVAGYGRGLGLLPGGPGSLPRPMRRRLPSPPRRHPPTRSSTRRCTRTPRCSSRRCRRSVPGTPSGG